MIADFVKKTIESNPGSFKVIVLVMVVCTTILFLSQSLSSGILYEAF